MLAPPVSVLVFTIRYGNFISHIYYSKVITIIHSLVLIHSSSKKEEIFSSFCECLERSLDINVNSFSIAQQSNKYLKRKGVLSF